MTPASLSVQLAEWARVRPGSRFLECGTSLTYEEAEREVHRHAERLALASKGPVVLEGPVDTDWVLNLLACQRAEMPAVLMPDALHPHERRALDGLTRSAARISGAGALRRSQATGEDATAWRWLGAGVAFVSSGTTGAPRLVLRSATSLVDEGSRYLALWSLQPDDVILLAPALSHAYGFGAGLAAALSAGCCLVISSWRGPRPLVADARRHGATILPLVAPMAAALAAADGDAPPRSLRIAMVGAGRPAQHVSRGFAGRFRIPLSHNYGSSETGAVLAALDPASPACTGTPLAGVEVELEPHCEEAGQLWVRLENPPLGYITDRGFERARLAPGGWWAIGDLFARDAHGCYTMVGRIGDLIRRGGRTISPREVEAALLCHPAVEDVFVRGQADPAGDDLIEAHVQLAGGAPADAIELRRFLAERLPAHKLPHRWSYYDRLPRTWSSKVKPGALQATNDGAHADRLLSLLTAYRYSEALLCAELVGLLDALAAGPVPIDQLAGRLRLDAAALDLFLSELTRIGVIAREENGFRFDAPRWPWRALLALEAQLRDGWLRADAMADVLRAGIPNRPFDVVGPSAAFADAYVSALCGPSQRAAADLLARTLPAREGCAILEIGRGIGFIASALRERHDKTEVDLVALAPGPALVWRDARTVPVHGPVPVRAWAELDIPRGRYELIVLTNAVHWLRPADLVAVVSKLGAGLTPTGTLAIFDIFLPPRRGGAPADDLTSRLVLDWMTHGGTHWLQVEPLADALSRSELDVPKIRRFGALSHHLILTRMRSAAAPGVRAVSTVSNWSFPEVSV